MKRQTGKVRSGKKSRTKITMLASIVPTDDQWYATFPELGSKKQHAQHFGETAADKVIATLANELPETIARQIESESAKGAK